ncbi:MAG TPA: methionyl-tRNA formyltransferase, partial [Candidatus Gracilibacteria bacterium]|nr:methionyl-tRNA formyltransferase [Candidatus Gracilibacteria bacterium]
MYKVVFAGTPEIAVPVLEVLAKSEQFQVVEVLTQGD